MPQWSWVGSWRDLMKGDASKTVPEQTVRNTISEEFESERAKFLKDLPDNLRDEDDQDKEVQITQPQVCGFLKKFLSTTGLWWCCASSPDRNAVSAH